MPAVTGRIRPVLIWALLILAIAVPIALAAVSPQLAWRRPVYIAAGFAGIAAMALLLIQPLLAAGYLAGLRGPRGRRAHRWTGGLLVLAVVVHVAGLWITSPPDAVDALLFVSPAPFSAWGVVAMWAVFASALLALSRRRMQLRHSTWRMGHSTLALITVIGSAVHAMLIEGTMETMSKAALCALVLIATAKAFSDLRIWSLLIRLGRS